MKKDTKRLTKGENSSITSGVRRRDLIKTGAGLAIGAAFPSLADISGAQTQGSADSAKTLIIASHPYPDRSTVNKALWEAARKTDRALFRNLESIYGDNHQGFDRASERKLYQQMERLVLMFPTHWFNVTPMIKAYMNEIWGAGPPPELNGKELLVVTTTGGGEDAYTPGGQLGFSIDEVLIPLRASAKYTGMKFLEPLVFFAASGDARSLRGYQEKLTARLRS